LATIWFRIRPQTPPINLIIGRDVIWIKKGMDLANRSIITGQYVGRGIHITIEKRLVTGMAGYLAGLIIQRLQPKY
jgi:hypothetical protein